MGQSGALFWGRLNVFNNFLGSFVHIVLTERRRFGKRVTSGLEGVQFTVVLAKVYNRLQVGWV